ncbi:MAG: YbaN family protein [Bacillota bacterium]|nr:YbaN family protein [Bacillota bacterium]
MKLRKTLYVLLGLVGLLLGAIGAVLPMMPAFPFLMLAAFCFARSSKRLERWFRGTGLYKRHLEDYVAGRGMTWRTKIRVMLLVTLLMSIGFVMMGRRGIVVGCIVLACIWIFHILYFCFGVKTIRAELRSD